MRDPNKRWLLVNCSNLHVGGAVAVAASFIDGLSKESSTDFDEIHLLVSSSVLANLRSLGTDLSVFAGCQRVDFHGLGSLWRLHRYLDPHDVVFTVFGPAYALRCRAVHVCGFAQPLIVYPKNPIERGMGPLARARQRLKYLVHEWFFARSDELIVELEHVRLALSRKAAFRRTPIHVVYNTVDAVFRAPTRWLAVELPPGSPGAVKLGVVSRNYVHKNLGCLPRVKESLQRRHGLTVEFYVTFTDDEWNACSAEFRGSMRNVGALVLPQCPSFYSAMDGVIFPSLLECFSATPLEAMAMRRPLFASDLPFIRDCCHEHANYFDPLSVDSIAKSIADYYLSRDSQSRARELEAAHDFLRRYPGPQERARAYLRIASNASKRRDRPLPTMVDQRD